MPSLLPKKLISIELNTSVLNDLLRVLHRCRSIYYICIYILNKYRDYSIITVDDVITFEIRSLTFSNS